MGSATPIWLTILIAVIAPTLTLAGVLLTQRGADVRAEKDADRQDKRASAEAERRLEQQRESERFDKLFSACDELSLAADKMRRCAFFDEDGDYQESLRGFHDARLRAEMVAPGKVLTAAANHFYVVLDEWAQAGDTSDVSAGKRATEAQAQLRGAIRESLGAPDSLPDMSKPEWHQR